MRVVAVSDASTRPRVADDAGHRIGGPRIGEGHDPCQAPLERRRAGCRQGRRRCGVGGHDLVGRDGGVVDVGVGEGQAEARQPAAPPPRAGRARRPRRRAVRSPSCRRTCPGSAGSPPACGCRRPPSPRGWRGHPPRRGAMDGLIGAVMRTAVVPGGADAASGPPARRRRSRRCGGARPAGGRGATRPVSSSSSTGGMAIEETAERRRGAAARSASVQGPARRSLRWLGRRRRRCGSSAA